jgi:probable phosphoglycerate mutase
MQGLEAATTEIYLIRHGETAWSLVGRHTGLTDVPLTARGAQQAVALGRRLAGIRFSDVIASPLGRAMQTCSLAGLASKARIDPDVVERDYGAFEGQTLLEIRAQTPGWEPLWDDCPRGESYEKFRARADRVVTALRGREGRVAIFSHGHFLRALAMRWIDINIRAGSRFRLDPASVSVLGLDRGSVAAPVISLWNDAPALV